MAVAGSDQVVFGVPGRYATALYDLAVEQQVVNKVKANLDRFDALVAASDDLKRLVRSQRWTAEQQSKALAAVLNRAAIDGVAANFLNVVISNRRLFAISEIIRVYDRLVAHHQGRVIATVTFAEVPKEAHVAAVQEALKEIAHKDVMIDVKIDPSIIGGLVVKLGSRMIDTSLRTKLNALRHAMKEVG
jgi:F-type H+-transporting ATPase subunit delta